MNDESRFKNLANQYASEEDAEAAAASKTFLNRVYNWMAGGLAITGIVAWLLYTYMDAHTFNQDGKLFINPLDPGFCGIFCSSAFMIVMMLIEFGLVIWLSAGIQKMSPQTAGVCFLAYAAISGVTLAPILFVYTQSAVFSAFFAAAGTFIAVSIFGYVTKKDLSGVGSFMIMGLFGLVIASLINLFLENKGLDLFITYLGVFIFIGLTAWDTQKLKQMGGIVGDGENAYSDSFHKYAILGALTLYLDFINLFLMLLRLFGGRGRD